MTAVWQGGTTYVPGALVRPSTTAIATPTITNADFESGDTGWDKTGTWSIDSTGVPYHGAWDATATANGELINQTVNAIAAGIRVTASCAVKSAGTTGTNMQVEIIWYDASAVRMAGKEALGNGNTLHDTQQISSVTAAAPSGAATFRIAAKATIVGTGGIGTNYSVCDFFSVTAAQTVTPGLIFKATQAAPGKSGTTEPTWPTVAGVSVTDNQVTWEGVIATRLVWQASPLLKSGTSEPTWPTTVGGVVHDGTIDWTAISRRVSDPNCPHSKVVAIMASKVFAADADIVRFSATVNPLDWTSPQDAGYLPTGLQQANSNDMAVLAPYRSNLCSLNASSFQNWQVDPDPSAMALLDQMEGIGSIAQHAAKAVGNELVYLSALGVRSVSIAAATDNLAASDVGAPVDALIQPAMAADTTALGPRAAYYPSAGQYWLAFNQGASSPQVFVSTHNSGEVKWSRYLFPFAVDAFAQLGNDLYMRHGDEVSKVNGSVATDDVSGVATNFPGVVWWPWMDNGQPALTKMLESIDYVGTGQGPSLSIGYDQRDTTMFTPPYLIDPDTLPGGPIPFPVAAPTLSVKLDFAGGQAWAVNMITLNLSDMFGQP